VWPVLTGLNAFTGILGIGARLERDTGDLPEGWIGILAHTLYVKNPARLEGQAGFVG
jgi:hypothetical protein